MLNRKRRIDTSNEFLIQRIGAGVRLVKPDKHHDSSINTLENVLNMPINVYFMNTISVVEKSNEIGATKFGFESAKCMIGKSLDDIAVFTNENKSCILNNNNEVMQSNITKFIEEECGYPDTLGFQTLSIKWPWYNESKKVIGLFGCSIVLSQHSLANSLAQMMKLGLLNSTGTAPINFSLSNLCINNVYLSKRETECLRLTVKGKTAQSIAIILGLSCRTVEYYLENIKIKMNVSSKSEMVEKAVDYFNL